MFGINSILADLIFIIAHFFLFFFNLELWNRKIFQPSVLFSLVWLIIIVLHSVFRLTVLDQLSPLGLKIQILFFCGSLAFSIAGVFTYIANRRQMVSFEIVRNKEEKVSILLRVILTAIIVLGLPVYIKASYQVFIASQAEEFLKGLRSELTSGEVDIGPAKYLMSIANIVFAINLYSVFKDKSRLSKILNITSFLSLLVYSVFATGRTYFLIIFSIYAGINFFANAAFSLKKYLIAFVIFLSVFIGFGIIYGKGGSTFFSFKENIDAIAENLGIYTVTPLSALELEVNDNSIKKTEGDNTLRFFKKIGMELGVLPQKKVADLIQVYSFVPYATNVYTYYSPYIKDFGIGYSLLILFLFGLLHNWLYVRAMQTGSLRFIFYYTFLLFPLFLSFFSDEYLTNLSFWIQIIFFTELLIVVNQVCLSLSAAKNNLQID